jgi:hypothetical protein
LFAAKKFDKGDLITYVWGAIIAGPVAREAERQVATTKQPSRLIEIRAFTDEVIFVLTDKFIGSQMLRLFWFSGGQTNSSASESWV